MTSVTIYTAEWCVRCRELKPFYEEMESSFSDSEFIIVDVDEELEDAIEIQLPAKVPSVRVTNTFGSTILEGKGEIEASLEMMLEAGS